MEILAPAGGQEQLLAAVRCGANAVYLGAQGFNARQNAENFGEASLEAAVAYCHGRNVAVYVTVNTLVMDDEMPALVDTLREVARSGADAVIVQDLAVAALVREHCPTLALHASTQMTIHNVAGARALEALGFTRVVLARELTLGEIAAIHRSTSLELEVFVHGALCMSVSGACYLSSMIGGRSGNRGRCAQPCRLDFRTDTGRAYALSLKDLSAYGHLAKLSEAGVCALKIEGRMKRPEYVAAAVTGCRQALAGEPYDLQTLQAAFSRSGFTDGYLVGKRDLSMFGVRGHEDVKETQRVQASLMNLYGRERQSVPVRMRLTMQQDAPAQLQVTDGSHACTIMGPTPQIATAAPTDYDRAHRSLGKTGDSPFFLDSLDVQTDGTLMLPASALNAMRREGLDALLAAREAPSPKDFVGEVDVQALKAHQAVDVPSLRVRVQRPDQLTDEQDDIEQIIVPIEAITPAMVDALGEKLVAELPALIYPAQEAQLQAQLASLGVTRALCNNLGAIRLAIDAGVRPTGGYGLNILNTMALDAYEQLGLEDATLSFELHAQKIRRLGGDIPRGILAYGRLPLMQLRCCPAQFGRGCTDCDGQPVLTDRTGAQFTLLCHGKQYATLLNSVPLCLSDSQVQGIDFQTLFFTNETAAERRRILDLFRSHAPYPGERTRGLYYRALQ